MDKKIGSKAIVCPRPGGYMRIQQVAMLATGQTDPNYICKSELRKSLENSNGKLAKSAISAKLKRSVNIEEQNRSINKLTSSIASRNGVSNRCRTNSVVTNREGAWVNSKLSKYKAKTTVDRKSPLSSRHESLNNSPVTRRKRTNSPVSSKLKSSTPVARMQRNSTNSSLGNRHGSSNNSPIANRQDPSNKSPDNINFKPSTIVAGRQREGSKNSPVVRRRGANPPVCKSLRSSTLTSSKHRASTNSSPARRYNPVASRNKVLINSPANSNIRSSIPVARRHRASTNPPCTSRCSSLNNSPVASRYRSVTNSHCRSSTTVVSRPNSSPVSRNKSSMKSPVTRWNGDPPVVKSHELLNFRDEITSKERDLSNIGDVNQGVGWCRFAMCTVEDLAGRRNKCSKIFERKSTPNKNYNINPNGTTRAYRLYKMLESQCLSKQDEIDEELKCDDKSKYLDKTKFEVESVESEYEDWCEREIKTDWYESEAYWISSEDEDAYLTEEDETSKSKWQRYKKFAPQTNLLAVLLSTVMLLARKKEVPRSVMDAAAQYLKLIKDEEGNPPPNVQRFLNYLDCRIEKLSVFQV